ncbi:MAG: magnesium transporter [Deltaproteobacteria bacterium]|nr:magnesium transporter [Candidatus Zymogenaceae bacterium]
MKERTKKLRQIMAEDDLRELKEEVSKFHPADIAEFMQYLLPDEKQVVFSILDTEAAADVLVELEDETRDFILAGLESGRLSEIVDDMESDDAADIIDDLPDDVAQEVLEQIDTDDAEDIQRLMRYDEESAGGIMQTELVSVVQEETVNQAIEKIRSLADEVEDIHNVYVIDRFGKLTGILPLRKLILAAPSKRIEDILEQEPITVTVDVDQEEVARLFKKYDLVGLPVVDYVGRLVGRITVDDIVDVLEEEATEDIIKLTGAVDDYAYSSSVLKSAGTRLPWLFASWMGGVLASLIIGFYENTLIEAVVLAAFMPVIAGMGGNVASQSSTIVVRGIAIGSIDLKRLWSVVFREVKIGLLLGVTYGVLLGVFASLYFVDVVNLWLVVGLGIFSSITIASTLGTLMPIMLHSMGFDPAISSGPFVTTATDVVSMLVYLVLATAIIL